MKKAFLTASLAFMLTNLFGQTGSLRVYFEGQYECLECTLELWSDSALVETKKSDYFLRFDSLCPGIYALRILDEDHELRTTFYGIQIAQDSLTTLYTGVSQSWKSCVTCGMDTVFSRYEINFDFLYSSIFKENTWPVRNGFYFNYGYSQWFPFHKNFNLGYSGGLYYGINQINNYFNNTDKAFTKQRYTNFGLNAEVKARIALFNTRKYWSLGPLIDFGAAYRLPMAFRYVQVSKNAITKHHSLHNYNDIHAFIQIGYTPVTLKIDYRINDFIRDELPQQPKWSIGLSIVSEL